MAFGYYPGQPSQSRPLKPAGSTGVRLGKMHQDAVPPLVFKSRKPTAKRRNHDSAAGTRTADALDKIANKKKGLGGGLRPQPSLTKNAKSLAAAGKSLSQGQAAQAAVPNLALGANGQPVPAKKSNITPVIPRPVKVPPGARVMVRTANGVELPKLLPEARPRPMAPLERAYGNRVVLSADGSKHLSRSVGSEKPQVQTAKATHQPDAPPKRPPALGKRAAAGDAAASSGAPSIMRYLRGALFSKPTGSTTDAPLGEGSLTTLPGVASYAALRPAKKRSLFSRLFGKQEWPLVPVPARV